MNESVAFERVMNHFKGLMSGLLCISYLAKVTFAGNNTRGGGLHGYDSWQRNASPGMLRYDRYDIDMKASTEYHTWKRRPLLGIIPNKAFPEPAKETQFFIFSGTLLSDSFSRFFFSFLNAIANDLVLTFTILCILKKIFALPRCHIRQCTFFKVNYIPNSNSKKSYLGPHTELFERKKTRGAKIL